MFHDILYILKRVKAIFKVRKCKLDKQRVSICTGTYSRTLILPLRKIWILLDVKNFKKNVVQLNNCIICVKLL